jgi:hypothetical protein
MALPPLRGRGPQSHLQTKEMQSSTKHTVSKVCSRLLEWLKVKCYQRNLSSNIITQSIVFFADEFLGILNHITDWQQ